MESLRISVRAIMISFLLLTGILPVLATSSCTARNCKLGDITSITCQFDTDVKEELRDFIVIHHLNTTDKTVVVCNWLNPNPNLDCVTANGFLLDKEHISSTLTVYIKNVTEEFAGVYSCQLMLSDQYPQTCTLEIFESVLTPPVGWVWPECRPPPDSSAVIVSVIIFLVSLIPLVIYFIRICMKRVTERQDYPPDATEEELAHTDNLETESEVGQEDLQKSTELLLTAGAAREAARSRNTKKTGGDEDESDKWTVNQVCKWLRQEHLGIHVRCFTRNKVNGKRLLTFINETDLHDLGMSNGPDGYDRLLLRDKIKELRRQVEARKDRERMNKRNN